MTMKQIEANQRNALKSTGPTSEKGKRTASINAMTHGILSTQVLLPDEDATLFGEFRERTYLTLQPSGEVEDLLADRIVVMAWRLRRAIMVEGTLFEKDPLSFMDSDSFGHQFQSRADVFSVLSRYETGIERSLYRALHEFQRLQSFRKEMNVPLPVVVNIESDES